MADVRPRVLAILPGLFPSTVIGVAKPLLRLHQDARITLDLTLQFLATRSAVERADVVVMCHTIDPQYGVILDWIRQSRRPLVYEIDDDLLAIPEQIHGLAYLREPARREQLIACLRQADVVRVYSPALQEKLSAFNSNVRLVSGPLDWGLMPLDPPQRESSRTRMVYATSRLDDSIGRRLIGPLGRVLDANPNVELTIWGPTLDPLSSHPRVRSLPLIRDYDTFFSRFAREAFEIGLAPLPDDEFHRGKSNNKFREYASCGIAGIYSDMSVYNRSVRDRVTGLLVPNDDQAWVAAIDTLIGDPGLRQQIGANARAYAQEHFNETVTDHEWMTTLVPLAGRARRPAVETGGGNPDVVVGLAKFVGRLATKTGPVFREHGLSEVWQRSRQHVAGLRQLASWELQRRRLQRRANAQRGRQ